VEGKTSLVGPDIRESLHGIAGVAKDDPFQKIEFSQEQAFKRRLNQMAAVRGKMGLHMGHLDGCAHEAERKSTSSMNEFFRDIGAKKADRHTILGEMESDFTVSLRGYGLDLFLHFQKSSLSIHKGSKFLREVNLNLTQRPGLFQ
jgi:hypothetical protein